MQLRRRLTGALLALGLLGGSFTPTAHAVPLAPAPAHAVAPLVLPAASGVDSSRVASRLAGVSKKTLDSTAWAVYTTGGKKVVAKDTAMIPASTTKILTAMAALDILGADRTFTTKVVSAKKGRLTLVGGGDPYLVSAKSSVPAKKANLNALVSATAKALAKDKVKSVRLTYSAPLFSGTSYSAAWKQSWASYTPRIMSLTVNGGMAGSSAYSNPARSTATMFASKLRAKGFKVTFDGAASSPKGAKTVAKVVSAPLGVQVRRMLRYSDNVAAENYARLIARATGHSPSFAGGSAAITAWLKQKKLWESGMRIDGGSGLSSNSKVRPSVLARAVALALKDATYRDVKVGLPVAGVNGTLKHRFNDPSEKAGRKVVHAKTGSLKKVNALAGYLTTADGTVLTFAFGATHDGRRSTAAGNWLDRSATSLVTCACG